MWRLSIAHFFSNISAANYENRFPYVQVKCANFSRHNATHTVDNLATPMAEADALLRRYAVARITSWSKRKSRLLYSLVAPLTILPVINYIRRLGISQPASRRCMHINRIRQRASVVYTVYALQPLSRSRMTLDWTVSHALSV